MVRCSQVWCESHARVHLNACGMEIRTFVLGLSRSPSEGGDLPVKDLKQAPPLPVDTVCAIEGLCSLDLPLPLRVFSGIICLCVHGIKRWSDVQHVYRGGPYF